MLVSHFSPGSKTPLPQTALLLSSPQLEAPSASVHTTATLSPKITRVIPLPPSPGDPHERPTHSTASASISFDRLLCQAAGRQVFQTGTRLANQHFMSRGDHIELEGTVREALAGGTFKISLASGHEVLAYLAGRLRRHRIRVVPG